MAPPDSLLHLTHMLDNIERIRRWTDGLAIEAYQANPMLRDAVERCLERISESQSPTAGGDEGISTTDPLAQSRRHW